MSRVGRNCLEDDEKLREAVRLQQAPKHESDRVVSAYFDQLRLYRDACRDSKHAPCSNAVIEEKLQTVQASYEKKVRSLMKSIDRLTKENERVKRESKDHRRTAAFKRMETELGLHDALLASFADAVDQLSRDLSSLNSLCTQNVTGFVPKTTLCARDVLEQFSRKGPPRIDFKSRMELSEEVCLK
uniref:Uncharacterized protein n=1 Tax=Chromera velia CCMP2878 TaxID=1169474 RepID=A0A0G4IG24_9ALVE|eukprot:Cvel_14123.t1-p1 / transcript=Cvel_14123.t1 / gene=Cvel_14123 / organism=Chromera_velia_CCMP2878 / gene_product=hypothetical protein / transcript_product=hypothetical protein / location=Cvel_scaffold994:56281-56835(+) / protein_length=185 / sequence_SO=supercontig / SO=protein_coding / is_pseudo=false